MESQDYLKRIKKFLEAMTKQQISQLKLTGLDDSEITGWYVSGPTKFAFKIAESKDGSLELKTAEPIKE